jgi:hypothetical protein
MKLRVNSLFETFSIYFPFVLCCFCSAAAAGFFIYRMVTRGDDNKGASSQPTSED